MQTITMIWGNDGWCYIPQLNIRKKFNENSEITENWEGVISLPEYFEEVPLEKLKSSIKTGSKKIRNTKTQS